MMAVELHIHVRTHTHNHIHVGMMVGIEMSIVLTIEVEAKVVVGIRPRCSNQAHLPARGCSLHEHEHGREGNRIGVGPINRVWYGTEVSCATVAVSHTLYSFALSVT